MTSSTTRRTGFATKAMYRRREPTALHFLSERTTFWVAVLSVLAFVTGNMMEQHGWYVFWKSVLGYVDDSAIIYDGTVSPFNEIVDPFRWAKKYGGDIYQDTWRQAPEDVRIPLPTYVPGDARSASDELGNRIFSVSFAGQYGSKNGGGRGAHTGDDIAVAEGTPAVAAMNGIVFKIGNDPGGYGKYVMLKHPRVPDPRNPSVNTCVITLYGHLSTGEGSEGDIVRKGQQIGTTGHSGDATGRHLHLQMEYCDAPSHPYSPVSSADLKAASMTYSQAIDAGLNRDKLLQYAFDPLLYIQANYPAVVGAASSTTVAGSTPTPLSSTASHTQSLQAFAQRRLALRKARLPQDMRVAMLHRSLVVDAAPVALPPPSSTENSTVVVSPPAPLTAAAGTFSSIEMVVGSAFTPGLWMPLRLVLLDDQGHVVTNPSFTTDLYLRTAYGRATFDPPVLSTFHFRNGVADLRMKGEGDQTIVVAVMPKNILLKPIRSTRAR
ncbi:M23 family metallopeptidase [Candidatus Peregrinibacteria bacterium]|nr:M23 family metallopeptidase [Candidatus Peregrinibacteria bacterium]MBI3816744.1 M23 family metallopeptidase [Candidatus Peregrinibacteria bacterium]